MTQLLAFGVEEAAATEKRQIKERAADEAAREKAWRGRCGCPAECVAAEK